MGYRFGGTFSNASPVGTRSHSVSSPGEGRFRNSLAQKFAPLPATPLRGAAANSLAGSQRLCTDALSNSQRLYSAPGRPYSGPKGGTAQELAEQIPELLKGLGGPTHVQVCKDPFPLRRLTSDAEDAGLAPKSGGLGPTVRPTEQWQPSEAALMSQTLPSNFGKRPASNEARPASWPHSMWPGQRRPSPAIRQRPAAGEERPDTGGGAACAASLKTPLPAAPALPHAGRSTPWGSMPQRRILEVLTQPSFQASAQTTFRLHDSEGTGRIDFAKLCSAVSALRLDLDLPRPDAAHLGQLFKEFGLRENATMNFSDFLKFFKEDLSQSVTHDKSNTANGPVNFKEFFALCKEGGGGSTAPPQRQADTTGAAAAKPGAVSREPSALARAPAPRQGADAPEEAVPFSFVLGKPRLREQRRTRRRTAEALKDPDLEAFSRDAFSARARDGSRQLGIDRLLEVLSALHTNFDLTEPDDDTVGELLEGYVANGEDSLNFTHFFELFKDELRRSALDAREDDMPLSFKGFFEILGCGNTKL